MRLVSGLHSPQSPARDLPSVLGVPWRSGRNELRPPHSACRYCARFDAKGKSVGADIFHVLFVYMGVHSSSCRLCVYFYQNQNVLVM